MISQLVGLAIVLCDLAVVFKFETAGASSGFRILHWPAMLLTGVGPIGLVLLCCEWADIRAVAASLVKRSPSRARKDSRQDGTLMQELTARYYQVGPRAFEGAREKAKSPQLHAAISKLALRVSLDDTRELMLRERGDLQARQEEQTQVLSLGVRLTPSIGMLGTILGMVQLLSTLKDPGSIGAPMSLALLTTFFGLFFSLILWTPLQRRYEALCAIELKAVDRIASWIDLMSRRKTIDALTSAPSFAQPEIHGSA